MIAPGQREQEKQILFDRDYEDAYSDPGSPALRRTHRSTYVIARLEGTGQLIMQGGPHLNPQTPCVDLSDMMWLWQGQGCLWVSFYALWPRSVV